jgi:hypothetical protein
MTAQRAVLYFLVRERNENLFLFPNEQKIFSEANPICWSTIEKELKNYFQLWINESMEAKKVF